MALLDDIMTGGEHRKATPSNGKQFTSEMAAQIFAEQVSNVTMAREEFFRKFFDPRRDLEKECGYPLTQAQSPDAYKELYDREPIATRVVQLMPKESWQITPMVYETEDTDDVTPFEDAWDNLSRGLRGDKSWFQDEVGSSVWEHLKRADQLSGIGHFGVLLLGIDDSKSLDQPVDGVVSLDPGAPVIKNYQELTDNRSYPSALDLTHVPEAVANAAGFRPYQDKSKPTSTPTYPGHDNAPLPPNGTPPAFTEAKTVGKTNGLAGKVSDIKGKDITAPDSVSTPTAGGPAQTSYAGAQGTDAQYVGVQFGPPEYPSQERSKEVRKLLFLRAFDESLVQVVQYEANVRNPRFGMPVMYLITLNDPREQHSGVGLPMATVRVHWSRVIHLADNLGSSEIFGVPRMRPVLNPLLDIRKIRGASAEGFWKSAFAGLSIETHPQLGGDVVVNKDDLRSMVSDYHNHLQRALLLMGMTAKSLAPQVTDPTSQINIQMEAICVQLGCPVRVFKGSERGELASSQDDSSWNDRLHERQINYITPRIIVPFIDRLIMAGVLPEPTHNKHENNKKIKPLKLTPPAPAGGPPGAGGSPKPGQPGQPNPGGPIKPKFGDAKPPKPGDEDPSVPPVKPAPKQFGKGATMNRHGTVFNADGEPIAKMIVDPKGNTVGHQTEGGYSIEWPDLDSLGQKDKASIALQETQALQAYIGGNVEQVVSPKDYLVHVLNWTEEQADAVLATAQEAQDQADQDAQDLAEEHGFKPEAPDGFIDPDAPPPMSPFGSGAYHPGMPPGFPPGAGPKPPDGFQPLKPGETSKAEGGKGAAPAPGAFGKPAAKKPGLNLPIKNEFTVPVSNFKVFGNGRLPTPRDENGWIPVQPVSNSNPEGHNQYAGARFVTEKTKFGGMPRIGQTGGTIHEVHDQATGQRIRATGPQQAKRIAGDLNTQHEAGVEKPAFDFIKDMNAQQKPRTPERVGKEIAKLIDAGQRGKFVDHFKLKQLKEEFQKLVEPPTSNWQPDEVVLENPAVEDYFLLNGDYFKTPLNNKFCPTGPGGGIDPSCGNEDKAGKKYPEYQRTAIQNEPKTPPPPGPYYEPGVMKDHNEDGVTDAARVGVPADQVPPPPPIPRLPNLTPDERAVEQEFASAYERYPENMANDYRNLAIASAKPGEPPTFATDDAKLLNAKWNHPSLTLEERSANRATYNCALHQTANALAKRAFMRHLDTLEKGDEVTVTVGGCGAGKGFALKKVPEVLAIKNASKAVWDSAGDQNATENTWVQREAEKRGLKVNYVYVDADPKVSWADPKAGVVKRAQDPADGRMVDAHVFADSYVIGARNHAAFMRDNKDNPSAKFFLIKNRMGKSPEPIDEIPQESQQLNRRELLNFARHTIISDHTVPPHIRRGALVGDRIWEREFGAES